MPVWTPSPGDGRKHINRKTDVETNTVVLHQVNVRPLLLVLPWFLSLNFFTSSISGVLSLLQLFPSLYRYLGIATGKINASVCFGCTMAEVFPLCWNSSLIFPRDIDPGGWLNSKTKEGADLSTDDDIFSSVITLCSQHLLQNKLNKNKSITSLKPWKIDIQTLCMIRRPGTGSKLGHHQTCKLHPARAWNSCTEWNSNPSCSCWDNSVWSGGLIHNLANSISQNVLLIPCFSLFFSLNCPQIRTHPSSKWACSPQDRPRDNVVCEKHQPTGVQLHPQVCCLHPPGRLLLCQLQTRLHRSHTASTHPGQCDR